VLAEHVVGGREHVPVPVELAQPAAFGIQRAQISTACRGRLASSALRPAMK
jgi:hypothetical protein